MLKFRCSKTLQKFTSIHASIHKHFNLERHLYSRKNIKHNYYEAGHMMYALNEELLALKVNVTEFIISATQ